MSTVNWIGPASGDDEWNDGSNWSTGRIPTSADDVTIVSTSFLQVAIYGTPAAAHSITIDTTAGGSGLFNEGSLSLGGLLTLEAGELDNNSGIISGGTIDQIGGAVYWGTLAGVTVLGTMGTPGNPAAATIENGVTVVNGSSPGTIYTDFLNFSGEQTQDNATVVVSAFGNIEADSTLTLGPGMTLEAVSGSITFRNSGTSSASIVNQGTIDQAGNFDATNLTNQGLLVFAGNTQLVQIGNTFLNEGTTEIDAGQLVQISPTAPATSGNQDGGTILVQGSSATLTLFSSATSPFANDGVIAIDNGGTFNLQANLSGGTIASDGSGQFFTDATLDGPAVFQGTVVVGEDSGLSFVDGFALQGDAPGKMGELDIDSARLVVLGSETLASGTVVLSGGGQLSAASTLDLGPKLLVRATGGATTLASDALLLNEGTIQAETPGGSIVFNAGTGTFENTGSVLIGSGEYAQVLGDFINSGSFTLAAGATLNLGDVTLAGVNSIVNLGGTLQIGTLDGQGGTLDLTANSPLNGVRVGTLKDITLITDGGTLDLNGGTLDNVTLHGMLSVGTNYILSITGSFAAAGLDGTGPGTFDLPGSLARVNILDTGTIDNLIINVGGDAAADVPVTPNFLNDFSDIGPPETDFQTDVYKAIREQQSELADKSDWLTFHPNLLPLYLKGQARLEAGANFLLDGNPALFNGLFDPASGANLLIENDGLTNAGTFVSDVGDAFLIDSTTLTNTGTFDADGGLFGVEPALDGTGTAEVGDGGGFAILSSVAAGQTIIFEPGGGTLQVFEPNAVGAPIIGFGTNDYIDLANITVGSIVASPGTLVAYQASTVAARLNIVGNYNTGDYVYGSDGNGGTALTIECFLAGSRIETPDGLVAVETLRVGDLVLTARGAARPVRWIGERHLDASRHPRPAKVWPIRIARGAFGPRMPCRDLYLSPDHAVFAADVLIPVKHLVNGTTIRSVRRRRLHYLHIELDSHDVILAEGLPVETYLDVGDRGRFENSGVPMQLHPDFAALRWEALGYAPLVVTGAKLLEVRSRLAAVAASQERRTSRNIAMPVGRRAPDRRVLA